MNTDNIHGHEILGMVLEAQPPFTRASLQAEARRRFGDARYCTCSTSDMTLDELLDFLLAHGKLSEQAGCLSAQPARICAH